MSPRALAFLCFFFSGSTGLMYEVVWTRLLGSVIGNTHFSITLVVSVFMGGLALGSYLGGRWADRSRNPLRLYGLLILCVGAGCLFVPAAVLAARPLFGVLYQSHDGFPEAPQLLIVRILFSALVLLIPTTFMGATLPALSRHLARDMSSVGSTIGQLYTINTLGAVIGTFFTGFFGIPTLGIWGCTGLGVAMDVVIGLVVLVAARGATSKDAAMAATGNSDQVMITLPTGNAPALPGMVRLCLVAFGVVGFANMLLQIAWTKALVLSIGNSTYAFSLIVTLFILGIAIGGGSVSYFVDRVKNLPLLLGGLVLLTAVLVLYMIPVLGDYPVFAARQFDQIEDPTYPRFLWKHVQLVALVILPSTTLMGTVFPIVGKIRTQAIASVGRAVGSAYAWNTVGSILGTLAAGFVFIPLLGRVYWTLYLAAALGLTMGLVLVFAALKSTFLIRSVVTVVLAAVVLVPHAPLLPHGVLGSERHYWHPSILSRGAYAYYAGSYYSPNREVIPKQTYIQGVIEQNEILSYREGIHAPVAVVRNKRGEIALRISGKVEASLAPGGAYNTDLPHQVMAGHLPMILHPNPREVLTLGLGGGVTLGTLTLYPVDAIDSLEIAQEVIDAAREFFGAANHHALDATRVKNVRNVVGDGRNHLEYTSRSYDVISSVPSNPWIAGIGNLFTVEFFETCRDRLRDGGIICNWIHKINMRGDDFRTVVRTFIEVFGDHAQLWDLGYDALLIGSKSPIRLDANRLASLLGNPIIARDLDGLGIRSPETLLRHYQLDAAGMRRFADAASSRPLNTDAFPILEFACPYGLYGHPFAAYKTSAFTDPTPIEASWIVGLETGIDRARTLREAFRRHAHVEVRFTENRDAGAIIEKRRREKYAADQNLMDDFTQRAQLMIADLKAIESAARDIDPWLLQHTNELAAIALGVEQGQSLAATLAAGFAHTARNVHPQSPERLTYLRDAVTYVSDDATTAVLVAQQCLELGQFPLGIEATGKALAAKPDDPVLLQTRGILLAAGGKLEDGLQVLRTALTRARDSTLKSQIYENLGFALQLAGRFDEARSEYSRAVAENDANVAAREKLRALLEKQKTSGNK